MDALTPTHLLILAGVFVLLFGARRLPEGARSLGQALRVFRSEVRDLHRDEPALPAPGAERPGPS